MPESSSLPALFFRLFPFFVLPRARLLQVACVAGLRVHVVHVVHVDHEDRGGDVGEVGHGDDPASSGNFRGEREGNTVVFHNSNGDRRHLRVAGMR